MSVAERSEVSSENERPKPMLRLVEAVPDGYADVAARLGFRPAAMVAAEMAAFAAKSGWETFALADVDRWLRQKAGKEGWSWRPLRDADCVNYAWRGQHCGSYDPKDCAVYDRLVPERPLRKALALSERFGKEIAFFVSDVDADPDPFIMAVPTISFDVVSEVIMVFDVWDEPGFGNG